MLRVFALISIILGNAGAARADVVVAIMGWQTTFATQADTEAYGVKDAPYLNKSTWALVDVDLVSVSGKPEYKKCNITNVPGYDRERVMGFVEAERELGKSKYANKSTFPQGPITQPGVRLQGNVTVSNGVATWTIKSEGAAGRDVNLTGQVPVDKIFDSTEDIARQIVEELCKPVPLHIVMKMQDLKIDQIVCDPSKPFTLQGSGKTAGLSFAMTPSSNSAGSWSVSGKAGGVPWSGGGTYIFERVGSKDTAKMSGTWQIKTPVGVFPYSGDITGTATEVSKKC